MNIDYQDKIDRYLLNQMQEEERLAFEKELNSNEELKQQLDFTQNVQRFITSRNEKLAAMKEWQDDYEWKDSKEEIDEAANISDNNTQQSSTEELKSFNRSSKIRFMYWLSGIAAIFIAGFFVFQFIVTPSLPGNHGDGGPVIRSGSDNSDITYLLNNNKFKEALSLTNQKIQELKNDSLALVQDSTIDNKAKDYKLLLISDKQDELKWYKACASLGLKQKDVAIQLLDELRKKDGNYQTKADSLFNNIK